MGGFLHEETKQLPEPIHLWYGTIAEDIQDMGEQAFVVLPDFADDKQVGPCFWQARNSTDLPQRGDRCVLIFDNRQQPWILSWWPDVFEAYTATTVAGLGTGKAGKTGKLRLGATPFDFLEISYDDTFNKWVSAPFSIIAGEPGASNVFGGTGQYIADYGFIRTKKFTDAGLRLQIRIVGRSYGSASAGFTTQVIVVVNEANHNDPGIPATLVSPAASGRDIGGTANATWKNWDTDWGWAGGAISPAAIKDIWQFALVLDTSAAQTIAFYGSVFGRWVSA